jgi:thiosulfate dehydrogenase
VVALVGGLACATGIGCADHEIPAAEVGRRLFSDPGVSTAKGNEYACATCHAVERGKPGIIADRFDAGANLAGVVGRPGFWGGYKTRLLDAIDECVNRFMGDWSAARRQDAGVYLYAYLEAESAEPVSPQVPLSIVRHVAALDGVKGDLGRGAEIYGRACGRCHGQPRSGAGRVGPASRIPDDTIRIFSTQARAVIVEKIRHGNFFNLAGVMPFFSLEVLSDQHVADILAYVGL